MGEAHAPAIDSSNRTYRSPGRFRGERRISPDAHRVWIPCRRAGTDMTRPYALVIYADDSGSEPVVRFLEKLEPHKRAALVAGLNEILAHQGLDVCATEYGKNLGKGLAEFRLRHSHDEVARRFPREGAVATPHSDRVGRVLLRVFFHAYGDKAILLLGGYDKGRQPSRKKQGSEIARARKRLRDFKNRQKKGARRFPNTRER